LSNVGDIAAVASRLATLAARLASAVRAEGQGELTPVEERPLAPSTSDAAEPHPSAPETCDAETWFRELHPRLYAYVRYRVADISQAEDLTSDIVERALTHLDSYDARKGAFSTWLFRIAHNTLANFFKRRERRGRYQVDLGENLDDLATDELSPEQAAIHREEIARLLACVRTLPPRRQEILAMRFAGCLTNREIARILHMNERTVSVAILRALRKLHALLDGAERAPAAEDGSSS
jgi:RNA polymerase sigma-70 factor (ECF subfamily)